MTTTVTVTNTLECKKVGSLDLEKVVVTGGIPSQPYPVTVSCNGTITNLNLFDGVIQTVSNIPLGTSCTIFEPPPPVPPGVCPPGSTPVWSTTYIHIPPGPPGSPGPPGTVIITSTTVLVMVENTLACSPIGGGRGSLLVKKEVINNTNPQIPTTGMVFAVSASCQSGSSPAVVTSMPLIDGGSQTVTPLAINTICTITEIPPGPPPPGPFACTAPGYVPVWTIVLPPPVTIIGPSTTALVQNILDCKPGSGSALEVKKTVINLTSGDVSGYTYPISVSCASA